MFYFSSVFSFKITRYVDLPFRLLIENDKRDKSGWIYEEIKEERKTV